MGNTKTVSLTKSECQASCDERVTFWRENTAARNEYYSTANHKAGTGRPLISDVLIGCIALCDPAVRSVI